MESLEESLSSSQEASCSRRQSQQQGSASGSLSTQAEAQVRSPEIANDSNESLMRELSAEEESQADHNAGNQNPRQSSEPETSDRGPRNREKSPEHRNRESSRAYRFEGRTYNGDRSRSPPLDRPRARNARSSKGRDQRRHSQKHRSGDGSSGLNRSLQRLLLKSLVQPSATIAPFYHSEKWCAIPKGFKVTFNQKSTVLVPMGNQ